MGWNTRPTYQSGPVQFRAPVLIGTLPSGYSATLPNLAAGQPGMQIDRPPGIPLAPSTLGRFRLGSTPLGASRDPQVGAFIRDAGIVAGSLGEFGQIHYVPYDAPDGRIGRFVIGRSPIGRRHPVHKQITIGSPPGAGEVEQP